MNLKRVDMPFDVTARHDVADEILSAEHCGKVSSIHGTSFYRFLEDYDTGWMIFSTSVYRLVPYIDSMMPRHRVREVMRWCDDPDTTAVAIEMNGDASGLYVGPLYEVLNALAPLWDR